jgi:hypothetical protein
VLETAVGAFSPNPLWDSTQSSVRSPARDLIAKQKQRQAGQERARQDEKTDLR